MNILFMCVANSSRSQMAEGLARNVFGAGHDIQSAGSEPTKVNPFAIQAMRDIGIDISEHSSKNADSLSPSFLAQLDYVITLCAEEVCPVLVSKAKKLHWPLHDPAVQEGTDKEKLQKFTDVRNMISQKLEAWKLELGI